ncbi:MULTISPECIES: photosystem II protein Psb27 [unclassified Synechococcus]|jgi:photosystem II Psb27 protein|uniref:photosystem II protein Psb27 n=1 Tax=unclassified Synechococcus TaxID=2626047 RepID=UPI000B7330D0|nr:MULTISPECIES: photosystem II protein Psb27 [unclassified Synechococcus]MAS28583.1 photosystem II protein Psb27 [Synechococcus sp. NAT40]OUW47647.1 MAG: photosystem II protein Psb27 [Synechococcus sp. TMED187]RZO14879.1 MAG: photosystem II protein Psb27 [Synechococcus sp. MED-G135]|tara:strand:- start:922 stop:1347 length:426 start_codon:yes stop_codon:yes gene_type:complete
MLSALNRLTSQLMRITLAACLGLCLMLTACSGAGASGLTGDYVEDTVAVVHTLQSTIAMAQDDEGRAEAETQATAVINAYMSRYRPRPKVNGLSSFTTMQTALNSLAAHYKTYANRPLPDTLRSRVDKELGKAEKAAVRGN